MKYKCIIIDNNEYSTEILTSHIREHPYLELIKAYTNSILALSEIMEGENVDFIFIDTEMPGFNGIKLGKIARTKTIHLIFTSSHSSYAVESYEINASGYLLKPINTMKFASAINGLILPKKPLAIANLTPSVEAYFFVKENSKRNGLIKIMTVDIISLEIIKDELHIVTFEETYITTFTLKEAEKLLLGTGEFFKIHRSFIVATKHINIIQDDSLKISNDHKIPIGKSYKQQFLKTLRKNIFSA